MVDEITKEQALKLVDTLNESNKELKEEKQQLIDFLEEKIKECYKNISLFSLTENMILETKIEVYKEILDFIEGGRDERNRINK